jgi:hypothetical protein
VAIRLAQLRRLAVFGLAGGLSLLMSLSLADAGISREDRIKAVLVFKLVKFVEWPVSVMPENAPIVICALGESPVGTALALTDGQTLGNRQVKFRRINGLLSPDVANCHVLYIPAGAREISGNLPNTLRGRPLLTVSEATDFARRGGLIGLFRSENRLSFEINLRNAKEGSLKIGAPLLELATIVE